ncbi:response regulator receiver sensor signal transduction histidine kinase [Candidatus Vecturithrix granuli]|uniref:histidine kinase n=1 Tax=Vecturithrix granuli TaxID=1499967 RepID=A0A081C9M2_VECG1|nr:response regulator receiver sensor signal transduction histidine kinase [Candidatus Vecturithrix granuli]
MNKATILIVDDNTTNLNVLLDYLHDVGYKVLIAPNGEQALQQMQHVSPDLILLDVMMPGIDGFETCQRLKDKEKTKDIPVIFMTALTDTVDKIRGFAVGGVDYITKPFQHEEVLARVNAHLTIRNLQQELQKKNEDLEKYADLLAGRNAQLHEKNLELDEKNAQLKILNADKDKFFSIIAHDLRNPLGALRELPQIIIENIETYTRDELIRMILLQRDAAKNLFALLENLLTWSRIQRGMIEYQPQQLNLEHVIARNISLMKPQAEQKQIRLTSLVQEHIPILADYNMIDTVIRNLISNALKFTKEGGSIEVSIAHNDEFAEIAVADTGIGIKEQYIAKLFRIDEQYRRIGTANEKGTGLGLILCKEFVEKHGGRIWVESEVGKGSIFRFTLSKKLQL